MTLLLFASSLALVRCELAATVGIVAVLELVLQDPITALLVELVLRLLKLIAFCLGCPSVSRMQTLSGRITDFVALGAHDFLSNRVVFPKVLVTIVSYVVPDRCLLIFVDLFGEVILLHRRLNGM